MQANMRILILAACMFAVCQCEVNLVPCPKNTSQLSCWCSEDCPFGGLTVRCQTMQNDIPKGLPVNTSCLVLSHSNITRVKKELHHLQNLKYLDLSDNGISEIDNDAFKHANFLLELHLNDNCLRFNETFPKDVFTGLSKLSLLRIDHNKWRYLEAYQDNLFKSLGNLKELHLDGLDCNSNNFTSVLASLPNLRSLHIYGGFKCIQNTTFSVLQDAGLTSLYIKSGKLKEIEPLGFAPLTNLTTLVMNENQQLGFSAMSNGWFGLQYTKIEHLEIKRAVPTESNTIVVESDFYRYLNLTRIKRLYMDKNSIVEFIVAKFRESLQYLEVLSLEYNKLQHITNLVFDVGSLKHLKYFSVAQQMREFPLAPEKEDPSPSSTFLYHGLETHLRYGQVEGRKWGKGEAFPDMRYVDEPAGYKAKLKRHLPNCRDRDINEGGLWDHSWPLVTPHTIEVLNASASLTYAIDILPVVFIIGNNSLKYLDYSENNLKSLRGPIYFVSPNRSMELCINLARNRATDLSQNLFTVSVQNGLRLVSLDLSGNILTNQLQKDNGSAFGSYKDLQYLNLSGNGLKTLSNSAFVGTPQLVALDLSLNSLRDVTFEFSHLHQLRYLNLSGNLFSSLSEDLFSKLDTHVKLHDTNITIDLLDNPLVCSCHTLKFLQWLPKTKIRMDRYNIYECKLADEFIKLEVFYMDYMVTLEKQCSGKITVIIIGIVFGAVIAGIVTSVAIYRHRWDIKFILLQMVTSRKKYQDVEDSVAYEYDAFVSFHTDDTPWVDQEMIPALEGPLPPPEVNLDYVGQNAVEHDGQNTFKLCVHERDFDPGTVIEENIIHGITHSRKTILVLTRQFVTSKWCEFELQMARVKCFDQGRDIIVIIMKEDVPAPSMSKTLRALIKRTTYIEWPESTERQPEFWERLRKTLRASEVAPVVCECGRYVTKHTGNHGRHNR